MNKKTLAAVMIALGAGSVHAATTIGTISYGGTGCPVGSNVSARLGSNGTRLLVYTPDMDVDVSRSRFDRKNCNVAIPISLAADERMVIGRPSVFGSERLGEGAKLTASAEVFLAGSTGPKVKKEVGGAPGFTLRNFYGIGADSIITGCGEDLILRSNAALLAQQVVSSISGGEAELRGVAFDIRLEQCEAP